jgi:4-hydroxyphenylpyruvate dioxygenase
MNTQTASIPKIFEDADDFMPLNGTDYLELYVGNSRQAAHYYKSAFGFQSLAYSGLATGMKETESYVVVQDKIRLVLTSPLHAGSAIGKHIDEHGDGVKVIALWVDDATYAYDTAIEKGAKSFMEPTV